MPARTGPLCPAGGTSRLTTWRRWTRRRSRRWSETPRRSWGRCSERRAEMSWTDWEGVAEPGLDFAEIIYEKKFHRELEGGVARISVNRPDKYNALTSHTVDEMFRAFYDANHDERVGLLVLAGAGDHFGTGGDVEWE